MFRQITASSGDFHLLQNARAALKVSPYSMDMEGSSPGAKAVRAWS